VEVFWCGRRHRTTGGLDMIFGAGLVNGALRAKKRDLTGLWPGNAAARHAIIG
jgi:hypothetical protein